MKSDLLPRSNGDFRLGADTFRKKLALRRDGRHPSRPPPPDRLRRSAQKSSRVRPRRQGSRPHQNPAAKSSPNSPPSTPRPTSSSAPSRTPSTPSSPSSTRTTSSPSPAPSQPTLEETPPFMRATTFASMDSPGPLRNPLHQGLLQRHPAGKGLDRSSTSPSTWPASTSAPSSAPACTRPTPATTSSSSGMTQFPSKIRKVLGANTNIEGWAHYTEQMMLDEGYAAAPPNATPAQIREAASHPPRPAAGRAPPRRPLRQRHQAPHRRGRTRRQVDHRSGRRLLRQAGLPVPAPSPSSKPSAAPPTPPTSTTRSASSRS